MPKAHFVVGGEFLTDVSRSLWADEGKPEKALSLLKAAFPEMSDGLIFEILTGAKKLTGDSVKGIEVEEDSAATTNQRLSLQSVVRRFREKADQDQDQIQMLSGQTEFVPSAKGLAEVPRRRTCKIDRNGIYSPSLNAGVRLEEIPHRLVDTALRERKFYSADCNTQRNDKGIYETVRELPPPPKPERSITQGNGWLCPEGKFYPCEYGMHIKLAESLGYGERVLERLGWLKVQTANNEQTSFIWDPLRSFQASQKQIGAVWEFCEKNGLPMPEGFLEKGTG